MKTSIKKLLSITLCIVMIFSTFAVCCTFASAEKDTTYNVGDIIEYGTYPQSEVTDSSIISALNNVVGFWSSYGYYTGTGSELDGNMKPSHYMRYKDVSYNGEKYRAVTFDSYRPRNTGETSSESNSNQDDNGYSAGQVYWFKYEPLKWRVLDPSTGLIMCDTAIDAQAYNNYGWYSNSLSEFYGDSSHTYYASNYAKSSIRDWLNDDFYKTAFSSEQKSNIVATTIDNSSTSYSSYNAPSTTDKVFLLSYNDSKNSKYGFNSSESASDSARQMKSTDYAKCQGCGQETSDSYRGNCWWWLRSPGYSADARVVSRDGYVNSFNTYYTHNGVVPALCLSNLKSDIFLESETNICGDSCSFSFDEATGTLTISGDGAVWRNAFVFNSIIKNVVIGDNITSIGNDAFYGCSDIGSVSLGIRVQSVESNAFYGCSGITSISVPAGCSSIGSNAFYDVQNVKYSGSASGSPWGARNINKYTEGYYVYSDSTKATLLNCSTLISGDIVIPETVKTISNNAFNNYDKITSVTIPDTVTSIGNSAFYDCDNLKSVIIGNGVSKIGSSAFGSCDELSEVTIGSSVSEIGSNAFSDCIAIKSIEIPALVFSVGSSAFKGCTGLESVTLCRKDTKVNASAFSGCSNIQNVYYVGQYDDRFDMVIGDYNDSLINATWNYGYVVPDKVTVSSISIKSNPTKTTYTVGETLNTSGLKLTVKYSDGSTKEVTSGFACTPTVLSTAGTQKITVTYSGKTATFNVTVKKSGSDTPTNPDTPDPTQDIKEADVIKGNSADNKKEYAYKSSVTFTANVPEGGSVQWYIDNQPAGKGSTLTVSEKTSSYTVKVVVTDKNGNKTADTENVTIKNSLWDKIVWFFKHLFNPGAYVIEQK